jgi:anaerobic selenocysteine-containing dehydrogenase
VNSAVESDGELSFYVGALGETCETVGSDYPYMLMVGPNSLCSSGDSRTGRSGLSQLATVEDCLRLSVEDATTLGVNEGSQVQVSSPKGSALATVKVEESLPKGLASIPSRCTFKQSLLGSELEPVAKTPRLRLWAIGISAQ